MRKRTLFCIVLTVAFVATFGLLGGTSPAAEFSADLKIQPKGENPITGKIFVKGNKIRQEVTEEGETQIVIVRPDKKVTWMLTPQEKMYMEMPFQNEDASFEEWTADREKQAKSLGEETVSGVKATKFEMVEEGDKIYYWVSKKYPFPIKVEDPDMVMFYENIKEGAVQDSVFELPAGYQKMSIPVPPPGKMPQ